MTLPVRPAGRRWTGAAAWVLLAGLAGCAAPVRVSPVATGQPETPAYQLAGPSLAHLRAEAARRCPQGFQILRMADGGERRGAPDDGLVARWLVRGADAVVPPVQSAQMMVLCQPAGSAAQATARGRTDAAAAGAGDAPDSATLPALAGVELPPPSQAPVGGYQ